MMNKWAFCFGFTVMIAGVADAPSANGATIVTRFDRSASYTSWANYSEYMPFSVLDGSKIFFEMSSGAPQSGTLKRGSNGCLVFTGVISIKGCGATADNPWAIVNDDPVATLLSLLIDLESWSSQPDEEHMFFTASEYTFTPRSPNTFAVGSDISEGDVIGFNFRGRLGQYLLGRRLTPFYNRLAIDFGGVESALGRGMSGEFQFQLPVAYVVPLPASGPLLLAGVVGLAALRRKSNSRNRRAIMDRSSTATRHSLPS